MKARGSIDLLRLDRQTRQRRRHWERCQSRKNLRSRRAQERRNWRAFQQAGHRLRVFPQLRCTQRGGDMIHAIMGQMSEKGGSSDVRASSSKTMRGDYNNANETPYTPLELFVMELFRTMSSNTDSFAICPTRTSRPMARRPSSRSGCPLSGTVTSPHRTQRLALQLRFPFQVGAFSGRLMGASPERPCHDEGRLDALLGQTRGDAANLLDRPMDEGRDWL